MALGGPKRPQRGTSPGLLSHFFDSVDVTATGGGIWVGNVLPLTYSYSHFYITNNLGLRRHSASGILTQERTLDWIFVCFFQSDC